MARDARHVLIVWLMFVCFPPNANLKCLFERPDVLPKRHLYRAGRSWPITIESSDRASHLLLSYISQILFIEVLGYASVTIVSGYNTLNTTEILERISACDLEGCETVVPTTMLNLEVWSPAGFNMEPWVNTRSINDGGPLGPFGRFGWYMPTWFVEENWVEHNMIIDHWRALRWPSVTRNLKMEDDIDLITSFLSKSDVKTQESYCQDARCRDGILHGHNCVNSKNKCALLLSGFPDQDSGVLKNQVDSLDLDVSLSWIGSHLHSFVNQRTLEKQPTLFFNWVPNSLTATGNYTRVGFPPCDAAVNTTKTCDFQVHQLSKIIWSMLETHAPEAYHVISQMRFTQSEYEDLLRIYVDESENFSDSADIYEHSACQWLRRNAQQWKQWLPPTLSSKTNIYLGGMFPVRSPFWRLPGIIPAAEMAVDSINANLQILGDYEVKLKVVDTQCKGDIAMKQFMHLISDNVHRIAGIIGPGCSATAEPIAGIAKHFNTVVVSYSADALSLSNRVMFPLFFRTVPSMSQYVPVLIELFKRYKWEQVALVAEDGQEFPEFKNFLKHKCLNSGVSVVYDRKIPRQTSVADARKFMAELKRTEAKIIILTSFEKSARAVICHAYKMGMTGEHGYVWFLPSWFTHLWWNTSLINSEYMENVPCTADEMLLGIQGYLSLSSGYFGPDNSVIVSNITVMDWAMQYYSRLENMNMTHEWTEYSSYAYDAVWVFCLALDRLLKEDPSSMESLHEDSTTRRFVNYLNDIQFTGVSGPLHFEGAERKGITNIMEFTGNESQLVGRYIPDMDNRSRLVINDTRIVWPSGRIPSDGRPMPKTCSVERFRAVLGVDCDDAVIISNIIGVSVFCVFMLIGLILVKRRYDRKVRATRERMEELGLMTDMSWRTLDQWEVPRDRVVLNRKLGEGAFGTVYGGEAYIDDKWVAVAVKTLKIGSNPEEKLDFLSEAEMMKRYDHENIVKLLGVCTRGEPAYTIMEFMLHGDLKTFLVARRQLVGQNTKESEDVTPERLSAMARDAASGLKYLTDIKFVHRDLACRNCLVHASKTVKIGDFGMARPMYDSDYYRFNKRGMLPVRWMAPESLTDGLFTPASDIWSFGVLLYEIVTFGSFPYQGMSNKQVLEAIKAGQFIQLPANISEELKEVMTACWSFEPEMRPSVDHILELLTCSPFLVQPCLDAPRTVVDLEVTDSVEMNLPAPRPRCNRLPLRPQSEHCQARGMNQSHSSNLINHVIAKSADPFNLMDTTVSTAQPIRLSIASAIRAGIGELERHSSVTSDDVDCPLTHNCMDNACAEITEDSSPETPKIPRRKDGEEKADSDYGSDTSKDFMNLSTQG